MHVVYHHRTRGAGAEGVHIMGIVKAFRSLGHTVTLLSLPGSDPEAAAKQVQSASEDKAKASGLLRRVMDMTRHVPEFVFELIEVVYNLIALVRLWQSTKPETSVSLIYERYSLFMFAGISIARLRKIPIVLEVNDSAIVERVRPLFFKALARRIESWIFRNCDGLVFISRAFQDKAKEAYGEIAPSVICPNGADLEQFSLAGIDREQVKSELGLSGKVVCGYVGAFVYWHGIDWFVREIAPHLKQHPHLVLLLVGDGVMYEEIQHSIRQSAVEDQVILTGRVPHEQVGRYIAAMDYGILPDSNDYGSPMKLFEMMAMEVALVSPAFGPVEEVVNDAENGWLFPPKNRAAAVAKVLELAGDMGSIRKVGQQAREYIGHERQWKHNVEKILELVQA
ncbi:MAG: glycosyltransferase WbuB [Oleiphilus sp.]|nr:MAG: glycosyltransferase WbuB [Oleiphilus sp.]